MGATARRVAMGDAWRAAFLSELEVAGNVSAAARAAGVSRRAAYNHRERDAAFAAAWDRAVAPAPGGSARAGGTAVQGASPPGSAVVSPAVVDELIPPPVRPSNVYRPPVGLEAHVEGLARRAGYRLEEVLEQPSLLARGRGLTTWGGTVTAEPIGADGVCPDCRWYVPPDRRWLHEACRDGDHDWCPRQERRLIAALERAAAAPLGAPSWAELARGGW